MRHLCTGIASAPGRDDALTPFRRVSACGWLLDFRAGRLPALGWPVPGSQISGLAGFPFPGFPFPGWPVPGLAAFRLAAFRAGCCGWPLFRLAGYRLPVTGPRLRGPRPRAPCGRGRGHRRGSRGLGRLARSPLCRLAGGPVSPSACFRFDLRSDRHTNAVPLGFWSGLRDRRPTAVRRLRDPRQCRMAHRLGRWGVGRRASGRLPASAGCRRARIRLDRAPSRVVIAALSGPPFSRPILVRGSPGPGFRVALAGRRVAE